MLTLNSYLGVLQEGALHTMAMAAEKDVPFLPAGFLLSRHPWSAAPGSCVMIILYSLRFVLTKLSLNFRMEGWLHYLPPARAQAAYVQD
jgi:hypothetical protein